MSQMSNSIFCFHCGGIAEGTVQEIFDEVGIELQLDKLLEEHFHLQVEKDDSQKQVLCEVCVNKLIELFDLAEHAKQKTCSEENAKEPLDTFPDVNQGLLAFPKNEIEIFDQEVVEFDDLEVNVNDLETIVENQQEDSQSRVNILTVVEYDAGSQQTEEGETLEAAEETLEAAEETLEAAEETLEAPEETLEAAEEPVEAEEFILTENNNENLLELNEASDEIVIDTLTVGSVNEQSLQFLTEQNDRDDSGKAYFVLSSAANESKSDAGNSEGEQGHELEFYLDELQSNPESEEIIDVIPDHDLQANEFDFIDVDGYLQSIIKSNMHDMQFNWLVTCKVCELTFETYQDFYSHIIMIHYEKTIGYTCTVDGCNELIHDFKMLAKHIILRHCDLKSLQIYGTCNECNFRFSNFLHYNKHSCCNTVKRRMGSDMTCKKCNLEFPSWKRYIFHLQFHMMKQRPKICFLCNEYFTGINDFFIHVHYAHEKLLACKLCDIIFQSEKFFKKHEQNHSSEMKYQCIMCSKKYDFRNLLMRHLEVAHNQKTPQFVCSVCKKAFLTKQQLTHHQRIHKEESEAEIFYCTTCGLLSHRKSDMEEHIAEENSQCFDAIIADDTQGQSYVCEFCNKDFKTPADVKAHRHSSVHENGLFTCRICLIEFKTYFSVKNHIKTHKVWEEWLERFPLTRYFVCEAKDCLDSYNNWPSLYTHKKRVHKFVVCSACQKSFNRSDYENHKRKCQLEWDFKCQFCGKEHPTKMSLSVHIARSHNNSNIVCKECNSSYKSQEKLKEHVDYMHTPVKCDHCTKTIKNQRNYEAHLKNIHLKQHSHACQYCNKTFLYKSEKDSHEKNVHSRTTYRCSECPFETTYKRSMQIHFTTTHKMEYEFRCHLCGREFGRKQTLLNHLKRHAVNEQLKCTEGCKSTFINQYGLTRHLEKKHGKYDSFRVVKSTSTRNRKRKRTVGSPPKKSQRKRKRDLDVDSSSNSIQDIHIEKIFRSTTSVPAQLNDDSSNSNYVELTVKDSDENIPANEKSDCDDANIPTETNDEYLSVEENVDENNQNVEDSTEEYILETIPEESDCMPDNPSDEQKDATIEDSQEETNELHDEETIFMKYLDPIDDEESLVDPSLDFVEYLHE